MDTVSKRTLLSLSLVLLPLLCNAGVVNNDDVQYRAEIIDFFEIVLLIFALVCLKQYFWPGLNNRTPFHIFNMICVIVFYIVAVMFLVRHKGFFEGFENLSDASCIKKYFLMFEPWILVKRLIIVGFIINILYIIRYGRDYFYDG